MADELARRDLTRMAMNVYAGTSHPVAVVPLESAIAWVERRPPDEAVTRVRALHRNERVLTGCMYCRNGEEPNGLYSCTPHGEAWECEACGWRGETKCPTLCALDGTEPRRG